MKLPEHEIKKIAVFRALQLGDMLCVVAAIRALRFAYPNAEIVLLGLPWASSFTTRFSKYFDGFIHFPGYPGLPEQPFAAKAFAKFIGLMQERHFDLILQMQGNGSIVNSMLQLFNAKYTAGFSAEGHYSPDNGLFMPYPDHGSEIERHIKLIEFLCISSAGTELEFPLAANDQDEYDQLNLGLETGRYVCIHSGSRGAWRQWPVEHFAALADFCADNGYKIVLTGTAAEMNIVEAVIEYMNNKQVVNTAGKTSLGSMGVLINNAALLISNCTGVSHMAAAFKTPSIVISMDGEPERWGPMNKQLHRTINWLADPDFQAVLRETTEMIGAGGLVNS